jgi:hypothetical protein
MASISVDTSNLFVAELLLISCHISEWPLTFMQPNLLYIDEDECVVNTCKELLNTRLPLVSNRGVPHTRGSRNVYVFYSRTTVSKSVQTDNTCTVVQTTRVHWHRQHVYSGTDNTCTVTHNMYTVTQTTCVQWHRQHVYSGTDNMCTVTQTTRVRWYRQHVYSDTDNTCTVTQTTRVQWHRQLVYSGGVQMVYCHRKGTGYGKLNN